MDSSRPPQPSIWLTFEPDEIIELKRITLDRDVQGALDLFERVVLPQVRARAERWGLWLETAGEELADDSLSR